MNRATKFGPLLLALAGAGVGICVGMLRHNEPESRIYPEWRIDLEESMPMAVLGAVIGAMAGCGVLALCARRPRLVGTVGLATMALLCAVLAAPLGWMVGTDVASARLLLDLVPMPEVKDVQHLPPLGMAVGAGIGCVVGLMLGGVQLLLDQRTPMPPQRHSGALVSVTLLLATLGGPVGLLYGWCARMAATADGPPPGHPIDVAAALSDSLVGFAFVLLGIPAARALTQGHQGRALGVLAWTALSHTLFCVCLLIFVVATNFGGPEGLWLFLAAPVAASAPYSLWVLSTWRYRRAAAS